MADIQLREEIKSVEVVSFKTSESIGKLVEAITKARKNFGAIVKSSDNPLYKDAKGKARKYADLAEMVNATAEPLAAEGVYVFQYPTINGDQTVGMLTRIAHSSGEWIEAYASGCPAAQKLKDEPGSSGQRVRYDAQTVGIGTTYLARYAYRAILNLGPEEDDDGNGLVKERPEQPERITARPSSLSEPATKGSHIMPESQTIKQGVINMVALSQGITGGVLVNQKADEDGCPVSDEDVPEHLKLPNQTQLASITKALKSLNQDSRLLKVFVEKEAGTEWKKIPFVKFTPIIEKLKAAEASGKLTELLSAKG